MKVLWTLVLEFFGVVKHENMQWQALCDFIPFALMAVVNFSPFN